VTELQQNRYDKLLRRVGGLIGAKSMVNDALGELFPTIETETLHAELLLLSDWRMAHGASSLGVSAGDINKTQLFNPVDSGNLIVPTGIRISSPTTDEMRYLLSAVPLDDLNTNMELFDSRLGVATIPLGQVRSEQTVGGVANFGIVFVDANVSFQLDIPYGMCVLAPGTGLIVSHTVVGTPLIVDYQWRERVAEQSELQF